MVASVVTIALIATAAIAFRRSADDSASTVPAQFTIAPPENTAFGGPAAGGTGYAAQIAISPDGRTIAFVAGTPSGYQIWLRPVATLIATPLAGTDGASFPFWSPDSRFIAFFAGGIPGQCPPRPGSAFDSGRQLACHDPLMDTADRRA